MDLGAKQLGWRGKNDAVCGVTSTHENLASHLSSAPRVTLANEGINIVRGALILRARRPVHVTHPGRPEVTSCGSVLMSPRSSPPPPPWPARLLVVRRDNAGGSPGGCGCVVGRCCLSQAKWGPHYSLEPIPILCIPHSPHSVYCLERGFVTHDVKCREHVLQELGKSWAFPAIIRG